LVAITFAGTPALFGQDEGESAPQVSSSAPPPVERESLKRFTFGGRFGATFSSLIEDVSTEQEFTNPPQEWFRNGVSTASHFGVGVTAQYAFNNRIAIGVDFLYRRSGYKAGRDVLEGEYDPDVDDEDERTRTTFFEQTRANYWDLPVVARIYDSNYFRPGVRAFIEGGAAFRRVTNINTFSDVTYPDGTTVSDDTPATAANDTVIGVIAGAGLQLGRESGVKVIPELRYTHWLSRTFDLDPTRSNIDQFEIILGITF
jgi:hypothetical protein